MDSLLHDLRFALRQLLRAPIFTLAAVLTLALGIGANTALFTLSNAILIRPRPGVGEPDRLVWVAPIDARQGRASSMSYPDSRAYGTLPVFERSAAMAEDFVALSVGGAEPERARMQYVSGNYFDVLRVPMTLGRGFSAEEDTSAAAAAVAVLAHDYWTRRLGADPGVLGRTIVVNGKSLTVVGV